MEIAIVGAGYVGLTSAACFCESGHHVTLVEIDPGRLQQLERGECPIYEPGLPDLLARHVGGRLTVTDSLAEAVARAQFLFVCVGTPPRPSGAPDLRALRGLVRSLRREAGDNRPVVVLKSTVPPGTNRWVYGRLGGAFSVVSNPEFLREGTAIDDFFHPDRVIVGSSNSEAALQVAALYTRCTAPVLVMNWEEAELVKYATNAFLAAKVSFANEVAALADAIGCDGLRILEGVGLDERVGVRFLAPGPGYGGSCLPKDLQGLAWKAGRLGVRLDLLPAARRANRRQRERLLAKLQRELGNLQGRTIAVWGLAFKAGTDDVRNSASLEIIPWLCRLGARVRAHDPAARDTFAGACPPEEVPDLVILDDPWQAIIGADALLILTEWDLYRQAPVEAIVELLAGRLVVDGRNLLDPAAARAAGLVYRGIGRG